MSQRRLLQLLLQPSLFSGTVIFILTCAVLGSSAWAYISSQQLFYDYLFGPYGLETYLWQHAAHATSVRDAFLASPIAYYIIVTLVATAIGFAVYVVLQLLGVLSQAAHTYGQTRNRLHAVVSSRPLVRILGLLGWAAFGAFFFSTLLPFSLLSVQQGSERIRLHDISHGALYCLLAVGVLAWSLHLHVIFMRLVWLRPRVFGGDNEIEAALARR